jgi:hypothetical protein
MPLECHEPLVMDQRAGWKRAMLAAFFTLADTDAL